MKDPSLAPNTTTNNHDSYNSDQKSTPSTTTLDSEPIPQPSQTQTTDPTSSSSNQNPPLASDAEAEDPNHKEEKPAEKVEKPDCT